MPMRSNSDKIEISRNKPNRRNLLVCKTKSKTLNKLDNFYQQLTDWEYRYLEVIIFIITNETF